MSSLLWTSARGCIALATVLALAAALSSAELRLGVKLGEPARPGYHKIGTVVPGSPAEAIGLKKGHVIVSIDGKVVGDPGKVRKEIKKKDQITIIYHDGKEVFEVVAELEGDDSSKDGGKVIGTPKRRALKPSNAGKY